jgi:hypothetical protein
MNSNGLNFQLDTYLGLRRALGYGRSVWEAKLLRQLADFLGTQTPEVPITSRLVLDWLDSNFRDSSPALNARRLDAVRQFLTYLSAAVPGTEIPELRLFARYPRPKPFLFSAEEIESILHAATASRQKGSLLPFTPRPSSVCLPVRVSGRAKPSDWISSTSSWTWSRPVFVSVKPSSTRPAACRCMLPRSCT